MINCGCLWGPSVMIYKTVWMMVWVTVTLESLEHVRNRCNTCKKTRAQRREAKKQLKWRTKQWIHKTLLSGMKYKWLRFGICLRVSEGYFNIGRLGHVRQEFVRIFLLIILVAASPEWISLYFWLDNWAFGAQPETEFLSAEKNTHVLVQYIW